jgi:hypothetical protein
MRRAEPVRFEPALRLEGPAAEQLCHALAALLGAPAAPLSQLVEGARLDKEALLDCCAALVELASGLFANGEWIGAFAALGMEGQLLEELVAAGEAEAPASRRRCARP